MKIMLITDSLVSGGKERQIIELLKGLSNINTIKCHLIILSNKIFYDCVNNLNVRIIIINRDSKNKSKIFKELSMIIKGIRPDIIHSWESMCSVYAAPIAFFKKIKFVNGMIRYAPKKLNKFKKNWIRTKLTFPFSNVILSNSYAGLQSYKVPSNKGYCIHNGFDLLRIKKLKGINEVRRIYNIQTQKVVGMVARFHDRKDYKTYILSANKILSIRNDVTFLAIGDGDNIESCKALVNPNLHNRIIFLGEQKEVESIINVFDIGILSSYEEGISNTIMEYMALKKPVIATEDGGNSEIVVNNETGFLINLNDHNMLAEKIQFLLNNPKIGETMGRAGKKRLATNFDLNKMVENYLKLYRSCLEDLF